MLAGPELVIFFGLVFPVLTLWALIDMIRRPRAQFEKAGQSIVVWAVLVVALPLVASVVYLGVIRRGLGRSVAHNRRELAVI